MFIGIFTLASLSRNRDKDREPHTEFKACDGGVFFSCKQVFYGSNLTNRKCVRRKCVHVCVYVCACVRACVRTYVPMNVCKYVCMYVCMYVCVCALRIRLNISHE